MLAKNSSRQGIDDDDKKGSLYLSIGWIVNKIATFSDSARPCYDLDVLDGM
jgi:hypothetical protein